MLTKGAIGNLINRYKAVLKKCNLINTFGSLAVASMLVMGGAGVAEAAGGYVTVSGLSGQFASLHEAANAVVTNSATLGDSITYTIHGDVAYNRINGTADGTGDLDNDIALDGGTARTVVIQGATDNSGDSKVTVNTHHYSSFKCGDQNSDVTFKNITIDDKTPEEGGESSAYNWRHIRVAISAYDDVNTVTFYNCKLLEGVYISDGQTVTVTNTEIDLREGGKDLDNTTPIFIGGGNATIDNVEIESGRGITFGDANSPKEFQATVDGVTFKSLNEGEEALNYKFGDVAISNIKNETDVQTFRDNAIPVTDEHGNVKLATFTGTLPNGELKLNKGESATLESNKPVAGEITIAEGATVTIEGTPNQHGLIDAKVNGGFDENGVSKTGTLNLVAHGAGDINAAIGEPGANINVDTLKASNDAESGDNIYTIYSSTTTAKDIKITARVVDIYSKAGDAFYTSAKGMTINGFESLSMTSEGDGYAIQNNSATAVVDLKGKENSKVTLSSANRTALGHLQGTTKIDAGSIEITGFASDTSTNSKKNAVNVQSGEVSLIADSITITDANALRENNTADTNAIGLSGGTLKLNAKTPDGTIKVYGDIVSINNSGTESSNGHLVIEEGSMSVHNGRVDGFKGDVTIEDGAKVTLTADNGIFGGNINLDGGDLLFEKGENGDQLDVNNVFTVYNAPVSTLDLSGANLVGDGSGDNLVSINPSTNADGATHKAVINDMKFNDGASAVIDSFSASADGTFELDGAKFTGFERTVTGIWNHSKALIYNNSGKLVISNSVFANNTTTNNDADGRAYNAILKSEKGADVEIVASEFTGNVISGAHAMGGVAYTSDKLTVRDSLFAENAARNGGALYLNGGNITFEGSSEARTASDGTVYEGNYFKGNSAISKGGVLEMEGQGESTLTLTGKNTFEGNTANLGGAFFIGEVEGPVTVNFDAGDSSKAVFEENEAASDGGAIYNTATLNIANAEFTDNRAGGKGGAIYNGAYNPSTPAGTVTFAGTNIFSGNTADGVANDIHNEGSIKVLSGSTTMYGGITGKADIDVAKGAALVIDTVDAGSKVLEGPIAITGEGDITLRSKQSLLDGAVEHSISGHDIFLESMEGKIIHSDDPDRIIEGSGDIKLVSHKNDVLYTANGSDVVGSPNDPAQIEIKGFQNLTMSTEDGYAIGNNGGNVTVSGGNVTIASGGRGAVANYSVHTDSEHCSTVIESTGKVSITAEGTVPDSKTAPRYKAAVYAQAGSIDISGQNIEIFDKLTASDDTFAVHANGGSISLDAKNALEITGKLKVEGDGTLTLGGSNGTMKADSLDVAGGKAMLKNVSASVTELAVSDGSMSVIDSEMTIGKMTATGGTFFADPSTVIIKELTDNELGTAATIGADTAVVIGGASIEDAVAGTSDFTDGKAALVLGKHIKLTGAGSLLVDPNAKESDVPAAGTATFAAGSLLAVDGHHADSDEEPAIITGSGAGALTVSGDATLYISNAAANETYTVAEGFSSYDVANSAWSQDAGTLILNGLVEGDIKALTHDDGTVEIVTSTKVKEDSVFFDAIPSTALHELAEAGGDVDAADTGLVPQGKKFLSRAVDPTFMPDEGVAVDTINEVSRAAVTAGVQNTSLRIADAASNTVLGHMSLAAHDGSSAIHADGVDFWAAPMYGNLYTSGMVTSGSSVRGQFGGLALGADLEAGQFLGGKFRLGAAINGGGGQSETKGTATSTQNDYDFGGLNFYAGWNSGALNVIASVGYGFGNHEVEMGIPVAGVNKAKADIDTSAFTADLRAEYQFKTPYVDILPHAGIRYTALKTEAHDLKANGSVLNSVESDTQNIVQFPVGVTLSKDFDLAGWNVKPSADVSVIPAAGDKKAETKVRFEGINAWDSVNTRVMDSTSWAGTIGVQAEKGNMTFGLNYGVQASSNETDQNIQVKFGWKF